MTETIRISFFQKDGMFDTEALGMGVYIIELADSKNNSIPLYIGESVWMIVRCAGHLYRTFKTPEYLGLINELHNPNLQLVIRVLEAVEDKQKLIVRENYYIEKLNPLTQKSINDKFKGKRDSMINSAEKIKRVQEAIMRLNTGENEK